MNAVVCNSRAFYAEPPQCSCNETPPVYEELIHVGNSLSFSVPLSLYIVLSPLTSRSRNARDVDKHIAILPLVGRFAASHSRHEKRTQPKRQIPHQYANTPLSQSADLSVSQSCCVDMRLLRRATTRRTKFRMSA